MPKRKYGLLKSSRKSSRLSIASEEEAVCIWVQCENEHCHKWRQISAEEAKGLEDSSWYCWLNRDTRYNTCSAVEQKAKKPKHMKFIYSLLPEGEVVMAKMSGYPPWPGLLTRDPTCGEYYDAPLDKENEITHYHVEFFGRPRSRAWLVPRLVHPFQSMDEIEREAPKFKKIQGRQLIELKKSYDFALKEAHSSLKKTNDERLASCHFKCKNEEGRSANSVACNEEVQAKELKDSKIPERRLSTTSPLNSPTIPLMTNKQWLNYSGNVTSVTDWREKEFLERLEAFSLERGLTVPKEPVWRGKRICFRRFYNLVVQHGGFENVCQNKLWNKVYNELLDSGVVYGGTSSSARVFYQRYLMQFELHLRNSKRSDPQFVPDNLPSPSTELTGCRLNRTRRKSSLLSEEGEQKVPETWADRIPTNSEDSDDIFTRRNEEHNSGSQPSAEADQVPSSNPDSPHQSCNECSFDSDESDDESTTSATCDVAEKELQQLERLLLSLGPSLYPSKDSNGTVINRVQQEAKLSPQTQDLKSVPEVDVQKTLDEIARIEGAIADLNSLVSLEMEKL